MPNPKNTNKNNVETGFWEFWKSNASTIYPVIAVFVVGIATTATLIQEFRSSHEQTMIKNCEQDETLQNHEERIDINTIKIAELKVSP